MCVCVYLSQAADSPHMLSVPMTWVKAGGKVRLDKKYLQTDYRGVSSDDIVYSISAAEGQPKYGNPPPTPQSCCVGAGWFAHYLANSPLRAGEVVLLSMPADSPPEGWRPQLSRNQGFTSTATFTQRDVDDGAVWYRHFGGGPYSDSFQFQVSVHQRSTLFSCSWFQMLLPTSRSSQSDSFKLV